MRICPLCHHNNAHYFYHDKKRHFYQCPDCQLVFADGKSHLPKQNEIERYQDNQTKNKQLQLANFIQTVINQLPTNNSTAIGLNFGRHLAGKALSKLILGEVELLQYDPSQQYERHVLQQQYDFICCYRVFDHFKQPSIQWQLLTKLLKPNGLLIINNHLLHDLNAFAKWHNKNNLTHVSFYNLACFQYLANLGQMQLIFAEKDLILMQKAS